MEPNLYPAISNNDSSSEDKTKNEKLTLMKLCRDNWTEWKKFFNNLLVGRGHKEIFNPSWCAVKANQKNLLKKSALAFTLLHSCLSANLKPVAAASKTFAKAMSSLAKTCGEKSLIKLGNKLYALICCDYIPGTLIATHVLKFQSLYTSLKSALVNNNEMKVNTSMAGIFFLKSFRNDDTLSSLVQNLHNAQPFTFKKLALQENLLQLPPVDMQLL
jgi:hypothetical protein